MELPGAPELFGDMHWSFPGRLRRRLKRRSLTFPCASECSHRSFVTKRVLEVTMEALHAPELSSGAPETSSSKDRLQRLVHMTKALVVHQTSLVLTMQFMEND